MTAEVDVPVLFRLWNSELSSEEIASRLGVTIARLRKLRCRYGLPSRSTHSTGRQDSPDPTPEEIIERAAEVRSRWSAEEEARRLCCGFKKWRPPEYSTYNRESMTFSC
jgi:hypothetical protein